jgi:hypothetical protein
MITGEELITKKNQVSPTSLAPFDEASELMKMDGILDLPFYKSLDGTAQEELYKCILFSYAFLHKRYWGKATLTQSGTLAFTVLVNPIPCDRIALVTIMTSKDNDCRKRLLDVTSVEGDRDLMKQGKSGAFGEYIRRLLRFFSKETSFGFKEDMSDVVHALCIQSWDNCFLITACDLVDLQMQRDLPLSQMQKYQCLDKAQVARRVMSSEELFDYVVNNSGDSGAEVLRKLLGVENVHDVLNTLHHKKLWFENAAAIEGSLSRMLKKNGPVLLTFWVGHLVRSAGLPNADGIPCFDSFDQTPVSFLKLDELVENEKELVQKQLPTEITTEQDVRTLDSIPRLQSTFSTFSSSRSFLEADAGNQEPPAPVSFFLVTLGKTLNNAVRKLFLGTETVGVEKKDAWEALDRTAVGPAPNATNSGQREGKRHSVVCIGGYVDESGKKWFLMRNSWEALPLFVASAQCLASAETIAASFKHRMSEIPAGYVRTNKRYTSCASPVVNHQGQWKDLRPTKDDGFVSGP